MQYNPQSRRKRGDEAVLGFVAGGSVTVVSEIGGNIIVNVKDSRIAIGKDMANKILV